MRGCLYVIMCLNTYGYMKNVRLRYSYIRYVVDFRFTVDFRFSLIYNIYI